MFFKKTNTEKIDKVETNEPLKSFLVDIATYLDQYNKMILDQEKETKKSLNKLFLIDKINVSDIAKNVEIILYYAEHDLKYLEEDYSNYTNQYDKVGNLFKENLTKLVDSQKELYSLNASFKELSSSNQWKKKHYVDLFEESISFVTELDTVDFADIKFNEESKESTLDIIMAQISDYGYDYKDTEIMLNHLQDISIMNKKIRKNIELLNKNKAKDFKNKEYKISNSVFI